MPFPWTAYMGGRRQDRQIRAFFDQLSDSPLPFASLRGTPDFALISTTRVTVTGFTEDFEGRGFAGLTDKVAGTIEIPQDGFYQISGTLGGQMNGFTSPSEIILFVRPGGSAPRPDIGPITAFGLQPNRANFIGLPFHFLEQFNEGEEVSLQLDAPDDINDLFIITYASFEIARRTET